MDKPTIKRQSKGAMKGLTVPVVLLRLGLPPDLVALIQEDRLGEAIAHAYAQHDFVNERLDAIEAQHPELAARLPWHQGREAWKRAGRPRPEWWDVLQWCGSTRHVPINKKQISQELLGEHLAGRRKTNAKL